MTEVYKIINAVRKTAFPTKQKHGDTKLNNKTFTTNKATLFIQCIMGVRHPHEQWEWKDFVGQDKK